MKYSFRIVAQTPLGTFYGKSETIDADQIEQLEEIIQETNGYFSFEDENGNTVILKDNVVKNSVFVVEKREVE